MAEILREFVIDNDLRIITPPEGVPVLGVEHDANVNRIQFSLPRLYGDVDLSTFELRVNYRNANREADIYVVTDAEVDGDRLNFSWLVGRHALQYKGKVEFIVCLRRMTVDGEIEQELNTTLASLPVLEGLEVDLDYYEEETARDVIQQLLGLIDTRGAEVTEAAVKAIEDKGAETLASIPEDYTAMAGKVNANTIVESKTGALVSITDGAAYPAVQLISHIEPVQEGEGDPSPDNVRPISGWDKVTAQRTGKNLIPNKYYTKFGTINGITFLDLGDGKIGISGTATSAVSFHVVLYTAGNRMFLPSGTYTLGTNVHEKVAFILYAYTTNDADATTIKVVSCYSKNPTATFTLDTDAYVGIYLYVGAGDTVENAVIIPQLEVGETATAYEPYQAQTLTATLPETVYKGKLAINQDGKARLTVEYGGDAVKGEMVREWNPATFAYMIVPSRKAAFDGITVANIKANVLPTVHNNAMWNGQAYGVSKQNAGNIGLAVEGVQSLTDMQKWVESNKLFVMYKLAAPVTYDLTVEQLTMLVGVNNVWSDCGDTELVYVADTKLYIDRKFDELQNAILAQGANV